MSFGGRRNVHVDNAIPGQYSILSAQPGRHASLYFTDGFWKIVRIFLKKQ